MTDEGRQRYEEQNDKIIRAFILRARRVKAHSLAQDLAGLMNHAKGQIHVLHEDGRTYLQKITPPEEQLESAAARVRPFLLNEELVYHAKVMKAIKSRLPEDAPERMWGAYKEFRERWQSFDSRSREHRGYLVQVASTNDDDPPTQLSDNVLGFAYIYGDTIHADQTRLEETDAFGVEHRFMAAVPIVAQVMVLAISTLNLIVDMMRSGYLQIPETIMGAPVTVDTTVFRHEAEAYSAPVGTEFPGLDQELGPEWERYTPPADQRAPNDV